MSTTVREWMQSEVRTVPADLSLAELEERLLHDRVSGFPVTSKDGELLGMVSRSDVVRQLSVERTWAEMLSDYYTDWTGFGEHEPSLEEIGERMGRRLEGLTVSDVMAHAPFTAAPDDSLAEAAAQMVKHRFHRLPVVEGGRLVGILTSLDLARRVAKGD